MQVKLFIHWNIQLQFQISWCGKLVCVNERMDTGHTGPCVHLSGISEGDLENKLHTGAHDHTYTHTHTHVHILFLYPSSTFIWLHITRLSALKSSSLSKQTDVMEPDKVVQLLGSGQGARMIQQVRSETLSSMRHHCACENEVMRASVTDR